MKWSKAFLAQLNRRLSEDAPPTPQPSTFNPNNLYPEGQPGQLHPLNTEPDNEQYVGTTDPPPEDFGTEEWSGHLSPTPGGNYGLHGSETMDNVDGDTSPAVVNPYHPDPTRKSYRNGDYPY